MKKLALFSILMMIFATGAVFACGGDKDKEPAPEPEAMCGGSCGKGKDKPAPEPEAMCGGSGCGKDKEKKA
jgi:hypothetical protein